MLGQTLKLSFKKNCEAITTLSQNATSFLLQEIRGLAWASRWVCPKHPSILCPWWATWKPGLLGFASRAQPTLCHQCCTASCAAYQVDCTWMWSPWSSSLWVCRAYHRGVTGTVSSAECNVAPSPQASHYSSIKNQIAPSGWLTHFNNFR